MPKLNSYVHDIVSPNNGRIVANKEFSRWQDAIEYGVKNPENCNEKYEDEKGRELLEAVKEHAKFYQKRTIAPVWITLTHPLYMFLTDNAALNSDEIINDANTYAAKLTDLLTSKMSKKKANVVLLETAYHYAAATSRWMEQGMVDRTIFTRHDSGNLLDSREISCGVDYFCGGGYDDLCFESSFKNIANNVKSNEQMWVITDMVINNPYMRKDGLYPRTIKVPFGKFITLRQLFGKLGT